jgi:hypothetical protein
METPTPFDLNEAIRRWQQDLAASPAFCADNLEELASHLHASVQKLTASGLSEEEAFKIAVQRIGELAPLEREFAKVKPEGDWSWSEILFWAAIGMLFVQGMTSLLEAVQDYNLITNRAGNPSLFYRSVGIYAGLISLVVLPICWLLIAGGWKNFRKSILLRIKSLVSTRLKLSILGSVICATIITSLPLVMVSIVPMSTGSSFRIYWPYFERKEMFNVALVLSMVLLARRGLCKTSSAQGIFDKRDSKRI